MNILVTGAGGGSGLATIRILKTTTNHAVYGADCSENASGLGLADKGFVIPRAEDKNFVAAIQEIVAEKKIDLILPNVDEELKTFASNVEKIPQVLISSLETIEICSDKYKTLTTLREVCGTPEVYKNERPPKESYPVVVKPRCSRGSRNIYIANSPEQLEAILLYVDTLGIPSEKRFVQEFLPGPEYTVDCMFDLSGRLLAAVPRQRIATHGGICSIGRTEKNNFLITAVDNISKHISFRGPVNIQFRHSRTGEFKLLEINARIAGGVPITLRAGVNIPLLCTKIITNASINFSDCEFIETKVYRYLTEV